MISAYFRVGLPLSLQRDRDQKDYVDKTWKLSENKMAELQVSKWAFRDLFSISLDIEFRGSDHAGPSLTIIVFGFLFSAKIYDRRHWYLAGKRWAANEKEAFE